MCFTLKMLFLVWKCFNITFSTSSKKYTLCIKDVTWVLMIYWIYQTCCRKVIKCSASLTFYRFSTMSLINSIKQEHNCLILFLNFFFYFWNLEQYENKVIFEFLNSRFWKFKLNQWAKWFEQFYFKKICNCHIYIEDLTWVLMFYWIY